MKKFLFSLSVILFAQNSLGEILEVYTWKPYPGRSEELLRTFEEAAAIHAKLGIGVTINALGLGTSQDMDYVLRYDDLESYGRLKDANLNNEEWNTFLAKVRANPSGELVSSWSANNIDLNSMKMTLPKKAKLSRFFGGSRRLWCGWFTNYDSRRFRIRSPYMKA